MEFIVWHMETPDFRDHSPKFFGKAFLCGHFRPVVAMNAPNLEAVFQATQNGAPLGEGVEVHEISDRRRSTSVGDVIVDESGRKFGVLALGFVEFGVNYDNQVDPAEWDAYCAHHQAYIDEMNRRKVLKDAFGA